MECLVFSRKLAAIHVHESPEILSSLIRLQCEARPRLVSVAFESMQLHPQSPSALNAHRRTVHTGRVSRFFPFRAPLQSRRPGQTPPGRG